MSILKAPNGKKQQELIRKSADSISGYFKSDAWKKQQDEFKKMMEKNKQMIKDSESKIK